MKSTHEQIIDSYKTLIKTTDDVYEQQRLQEKLNEYLKPYTYTYYWNGCEPSC